MMVKLLALLLAIKLSFANFYEDALFCAYHLKEPERARFFCLKALDEKPSYYLYLDTLRVLLSLKDYILAGKIAKEFLDMYPYKVEPYIILYSIYKSTGREKNALKIIEKAYKVFPEDKKVIFFLVDEYLKTKNLNKAEKIVKKLIKEDPENPLFYYILGRIYLSKGEENVAIKYFEKSLKTGNFYPPAVIAMGSLYERGKKLSEAEELYKSFLERYPDNKLILEKLAKLYIASNRLDEAKKVYEKLLELDPNNENYLQDYALVLISIGEFERAREILEKLYYRDPGNLNIVYAYALSLELTGEIKKAKELYEELLNELPNNVKVIERLVGIYIDLKNYEDAKRLIEKVKYIGEGSLTLALLEAELLSRKGKHKEALDLLNELEKSYTDDYRIYFSKAIIYDYLEDYKKAEENLRKAIELNPENPDLYNHLGYSLLLWYGEKRVKEAKELIEKALQKEPENPAYLDSMGWAYYMERDYEKAIQYLLKSLRKVYDDPVVNEHVGDVLLKMGFKEEAKRYYEKALKLLEEGKQGEKGQKERILKKLKSL